MGSCGSFEKLSRLIERYESDGGRVQRVEAVTADGESGTGLNVTLNVPVSLCSNGESGGETSPQAATISDDGGLRIEFPPSILPGVGEYIPEDASAEREDVRVTDDGTVLTTFALTFGVESEDNRSAASTPVGSDSRTCSTAGADGQVQTASDDAITPTTIERAVSDREGIASTLEAARNEDLPTYEDTEYLQCLYDSFETFTEMSTHFEMDVASETVRRYMIDAGVHEPSSYNTGDESEADDRVTDDDSATESIDDAVAETDESTSADASIEDAQSSTASESERVAEPEDPIEDISNKTVVADGIGLPDDLTIEEIADAIESSLTVYEIQRQLDLGRERTGELLKQLNLIDLVRRRLSRDPDRQITREEIAKRIRASSMNDC